MMAADKSKMAKFSVEEVFSYGIFDEDGSLVGAKDDAPAEFKEAFEADKKMYDDALAQGIAL